MTKKWKLFKKRRKTVPMTPLKKIVQVIASPGSKHERIPAIKEDAPDVKWEKPKTTKGAHVVNMVTKKLTTKSGEEFDFETLEKFKEETGKRAIYAGNATKAFREWLDQKHA